MSRIGDFFRGIFGGGGGEQPPQTISPEAYFGGTEAWVLVSSSNVHSIAYYGMGASGILAVRFGGKGRPMSEYWYRGVPVKVWESFLEAGSKGKFVWSDLRDRYAYERRK